MTKQYRVMWICDIVADNEGEAASQARHAIANAPYSYFDVYAEESSSPQQVEVPNDGAFIDGTAHPYYPLIPKVNN